MHIYIVYASYEKLLKSPLPIGSYVIQVKVIELFEPNIVNTYNCLHNYVCNCMQIYAKYAFIMCLLAYFSVAISFYYAVDVYG